MISVACHTQNACRSFLFVNAIAANGVSHKTYCGEYTLLASITDARTKNEILTGLLYLNTEWKDLHGTLSTCSTPLNKLKEEDLCPGVETLKEINAGYR